MKVAVLGAAGGIGQALALLLKTQLPSASRFAISMYISGGAIATAQPATP
ncbi:hypothetical protein ACUOFC_55830, partial [Escherichia sp. TWPC-MK]